MIRLEIPRVTPSLNTLLRLHWSRRRVLNRVWGYEVLAAVASARIGKPHLAHCKLEIERIAPRPIRDMDNAYGGLKPLLDALVNAGVLEDDDRKVIGEPILTQTIGPPRTIVTITPLAAESPSGTSR